VPVEEEEEWFCIEQRKFNLFGIDQIVLAVYEVIKCVLSICMFRDMGLVYVDNETNLTVLVPPEYVCKNQHLEHESLYLWEVRFSGLSRRE
jgi:hypothetical protein